MDQFVTRGGTVLSTGQGAAQPPPTAASAARPAGMPASTDNDKLDRSLDNPVVHECVSAHVAARLQLFRKEHNLSATALPALVEFNATNVNGMATFLCTLCKPWGGKPRSQKLGGGRNEISMGSVSRHQDSPMHVSALGELARGTRKRAGPAGPEQDRYPPRAVTSPPTARDTTTTITTTLDSPAADTMDPVHNSNIDADTGDRAHKQRCFADHVAARNADAISKMKGTSVRPPFEQGVFAVTSQTTATVRMEQLRREHWVDFRFFDPDSKDGPFISCRHCGHDKFTSPASPGFNTESLRNHLNGKKCMSHSLFRMLKPVQQVLGPSLLPTLQAIPLSVICRGYHQPTIDVNGSPVLAKVLHEGHGKGWHGVPTSRFSYTTRAGELVVRVGTVRSNDCTGLSVQGDGRTPDHKYCCGSCHAVANSKAARAMILRKQQRGSSALSKHARVDQMSTLDAQEQQRQRASMSHSKSKTIYDMKSTVTKLRTRLGALEAAVKQDDVAKFIHCVEVIGRSGDAETRNTTLEHCLDLMDAEARSEDDKMNGTQSRKGMRWSRQSKDLAACLKLKGGSKIPLFMKLNVGGPALSTIKSHLATTKVQFHIGEAPADNLKQLAALWTEQRQAAIELPEGHPDRLEKDAKIFVQMAEDETPMVQAPGVVIAGDDKADGSTPAVESAGERCGPGHSAVQPPGHFIGSCGKKCHLSGCASKPKECKHHKCDFGFVVPFPLKPEDMEAALIDYVVDNVQGTYIRAMVANPLSPVLSPGCVAASPTCNRFDAFPQVSDQRVLLRRVWREVMPSWAVLIGGASDGDARRFLLHVWDMNMFATGRYTVAPHEFILKINSPIASSLLAILIRTDGNGNVLEVVGMHCQDSIHDAKKTDAVTLSTKLIPVGPYRATAAYLGPLTTGDKRVGGVISEAGVRHEDYLRLDRQNFKAVIRRTGWRCLLALTAMQPQFETQGLVLVYTMLNRYVCAWFSQKATLSARVVSMGFVMGVMRRMLLNVMESPGLSVEKNHWPHQTHRHVIASCHELVFYLIIMNRYCPNQRAMLEKMGSDPCERLFSNAGGNGAIMQWMRDYGFTEFVKYLSDDFTLNAMTTNGRLSNSKAHGKMEFESKYAEDQSLPDASLTDYPDEADIGKLLLQGDDEARKALEALGAQYRYPKGKPRVLLDPGKWAQPPDMDWALDDLEFSKNYKFIDAVAMKTSKEAQKEADDAAAATAGQSVDSVVAQAAPQPAAAAPSAASPPAAAVADQPADPVRPVDPRDATDNAIAIAALPPTDISKLDDELGYTGGYCSMSVSRVLGLVGTAGHDPPSSEDSAVTQLNSYLAGAVGKMWDRRTVHPAVETWTMGRTEVNNVPKCNRCCFTAMAAEFHRLLVAKMGQAVMRYDSPDADAGCGFGLAAPQGTDGRTQQAHQPVFLEFAKYLRGRIVDELKANKDKWRVELAGIVHAEFGGDYDKMVSHEGGDLNYGGEVSVRVAADVLRCSIRLVSVHDGAVSDLVYGDANLPGFILAYAGKYSADNPNSNVDHYYPVGPAALATATGGDTAGASDASGGARVDPDDQVGELQLRLRAAVAALVKTPEIHSVAHNEGDKLPRTMMLICDGKRRACIRTVLAKVHAAVLAYSKVALVATDKNRLSNIAANAAKSVALDTARVEAVMEGDHLELFSDVMLYFQKKPQKGNKKPAYDLYLGRVLAMTKTVNGRKLSVIHGVPLDNFPDSLEISCTYYKRLSGGQNRDQIYKYGVAGGGDYDVDAYDMQCCLGLARPEYSEDNENYMLEKVQYQHFLSLADQMTPDTVASAIKVAAQKKRSRAATEAPTTGIAELQAANKAKKKQRKEQQARST